MKNLFFYILLISGLTTSLISCDNQEEGTAQKETTVKNFECSAEEIEDDLFLCSEKRFGGGIQQSSDYARSGNFSCKTNHSSPFAFVIAFENVKKGELIHTQMWMKSTQDSTGSVVVISDNEARQFDSNSYIVKIENGWTLMANTFKAIEDYDMVKSYGFNDSKTDVFFDDVAITRMSVTPKPPLTDSTLRIYIPPFQFSILDSFLTQGRKEDVLKDEYKQYVSGFILQKGDSTPVKIRLKGDWTDHLKTDKYSLRIKISGNHAYDGLKSFSIQNPETRGMMMEWYIHQICAEEDLLTTRYEFLNVEINGEIKGVYALEEHFDKQLLEARNRREGPIIKLDEAGLWQLNYALETKPIKLFPPAFIASSILPFKQNRTYKNPTLREQFLVAQSNLNKYKNLENHPDQFLNLEAFAKYIAIADLGNIDHALAWHNQRQYYNPVTAKLEPILYDCFQDKRYLSKRKLFYLLDEDLTNKRPTNLNLALLRNTEFRDYYLSYILKLGSSEFIEKFNQKSAAKIQTYLELLAYEYPFYQSNEDLIYFQKNAQALESNSDSLRTFLNNIKKVTFETDKWKKFPDSLDYFYPSIALKAHLEKEENGRNSISLKNYHQADITIIGYSTDSLPNELIHLNSPLSFEAFKYQSRTKYVSLPLNAQYIHYAPKNLKGKVVKALISKWPLPQEIDVRGNYTSLPSKKLVDGEIILEEGIYKFDRNIVVDGADKLIIEAGTQIDLTNTAGFICYIPVELRGSAEKPISIYSSDNSASGFNVFSEDGHSKMEYVTFNGLNSMNKNHWILTGAVTIYGGSVEISNCSFLDNKCEDGLNLIRSNFTIDQCTIQTTFSDGFDADFCTGVISNSKILDTTNDALDFSGSQIEIIDCEIKNVGDKGISGGENSQLKISNTSVYNSFIGIAAKDYSQLEVSNVELKKCTFAYTAFKKKPEYGPASITVKNHAEIENMKMLLDLDSRITIGSITQVGEEKLDIEQLYLSQ